jgi:antitoxin MazE
MEQVMKIAKWGNSLAVRIPKDVVDALELEEGDEISLRAADRGVVEVARKLSRDQAIEQLRKFRGRLPADYRFDRHEANAR